jgi:hypothetical protein
MNSPVAGTHMIVLPGGGYAAHAPHEAEPVATWLSGIGVQASVFRYPLIRILYEVGENTVTVYIINVAVTV